MQDRPTALELLRAARDFCEHDLIPELTGRVRFHARVLQNVLGILEREWEGEEKAVRAEFERLELLLGRTDDLPSSFAALRADVLELNKDLSKKVRAGELDDQWDEAVETVYQTVLDKLAIANPGHSASSET